MYFSQRGDGAACTAGSEAQTGTSLNVFTSPLSGSNSMAHDGSELIVLAAQSELDSRALFVAIDFENK